MNRVRGGYVSIFVLNERAVDIHDITFVCFSAPEETFAIGHKKGVGTVSLFYLNIRSWRYLCSR